MTYRVSKNKWVGKLPVNSRITIDYSKKEPKVKFAYPKKNALNQTTNNTLTILLAIIATCIILIFFMIQLETPSQIKACDIYSIYNTFYNGTAYDSIQHYRFECYYEDGSMKNHTIDSYYGWGILGFSEPPTFYEVGASRSNLKDELLIFGLVLFLFVFNLYFIGFLFAKTKFGQRKFPIWNKRLLNAHWSCTFKPKDIKKDGKHYITELPLFDNIYMDFHAKGEMSKYLQRIEIKEHPFKRLKRKRGKKMRKRKIFKDKNIELWKCTYYFNKKPTTGELEVKWT